MNPDNRCLDRNILSALIAEEVNTGSSIKFTKALQLCAGRMACDHDVCPLLQTKPITEQSEPLHGHQLTLEIKQQNRLPSIEFLPNYPLDSSAERIYIPGMEIKDNKLTINQSEIEIGTRIALENSPFFLMLLVENPKNPQMFHEDLPKHVRNAIALAVIPYGSDARRAELTDYIAFWSNFFSIANLRPFSDTTVEEGKQNIVAEIMERGKPKNLGKKGATLIAEVVMGWLEFIEPGDYKRLWPK